VTRPAPRRLRVLRRRAIAATIILIAMRLIAVRLELAGVIRLLHAGTRATALAAWLPGGVGEPAAQHGGTQAGFRIRRA